MLFALGLLSLGGQATRSSHKFNFYGYIKRQKNRGVLSFVFYFSFRCDSLLSSHPDSHLLIDERVSWDRILCAVFHDSRIWLRNLLVLKRVEQVTKSVITTPVTQTVPTPILSYLSASNTLLIWLTCVHHLKQLLYRDALGDHNTLEGLCHL